MWLSIFSLEDDVRASQSHEEVIKDLLCIYTMKLVKKTSCHFEIIYNVANYLKVLQVESKPADEKLSLGVVVKGVRQQREKT